MKNETTISYFQVGTIVKVNSEFLCEPVGVKAFVYENYGSGISLITENGCDLGGFSIKEQAEYLEYYTDSGMHYVFHNVRVLDEDFKNGVFKPYFELPQKQLNA